MWALKLSRLGLRPLFGGVLLIAQEKLTRCTPEQHSEEGSGKDIVALTYEKIWYLASANSVSLGYCGDPDPIHREFP